MPTFTYRVRSRVWLLSEPGGWHFVTLPKRQSTEIRRLFGTSQRAWGAIPVVATVGSTSWKTSIFRDQESDRYVLPLKAEVRKKEQIKADRVIAYSVRITP